MHIAGTSLAGIEANVSGYGALFTDVVRVAWDSPEELSRAIETAGPERVAAFFCEPIIGAGGVFAPPEGYLAEVRAICRQAGVLFVSDEVITGFGRTGHWFASTRWDLRPDLITCAKGITSGYLPMGAVIAAPWIAEPFRSPGAGMWRHGYTYSGHAAVAAVALANIDIIEREDLCGRAGILEKELTEFLAPLTDHPLVSEVRSGTGAMAAVQIDPGRIAADPGLPAAILMAVRSHGVLSRLLTTGALQVSPALVIDAEGLAEISAGIGAALDSLV